MEFKLTPADEIPQSFRKKGRKKPKFEVEIAYMNRITGRDTRPKLKGM